MSRRRYRWNPETKALEELGADYSDTERRAPVPTEELTYGGMAATDGTPINTRKRHAQYMKRNGLAMASDYTETWARAAKEREAQRAGTAPDKTRREAVARAAYLVEKKHGR